MAIVAVPTLALLGPDGGPPSRPRRRVPPRRRSRFREVGIPAIWPVIPGARLGRRPHPWAVAAADLSETGLKATCFAPCGRARSRAKGVAEGFGHGPRRRSAKVFSARRLAGLPTIRHLAAPGPLADHRRLRTAFAVASELE